MLAFTDVIHLFLYEFTCLCAGRFSFRLVFSSAFQSFLFRHMHISLERCFLSNDANPQAEDGIALR